MDPRRRPPRRANPAEEDDLDNLDLERLKDLAESGGYRLVSARIAKLRESKLRDLIQPTDAVETATLRGYIAGLDAAANIPAILIREAKEKTPHAPRTD